MINIGSIGLSDMRIGTSQVLSGYVGTDLVYPVYVDCGCIYASTAGTQTFIPLNIFTSKNLRWRFQGQILANAGGTLIGAVNQAETDDYRFFRANDTNAIFDVGNQRGLTQSSNFPLNTDLDFSGFMEETQLQGTYYANINSGGTNLIRFSTGGCTDGKRIQLNISRLKIYSFQAWDGENMIFDGVPRVRISDGKAGLYDTINREFYTTSNTIVRSCVPYYVGVNSIWGGDVDNRIWLPVYSSLTLKCRFTGQIRNYRNNTIVGSTAATLGSEWRLFYTTNDNTGTYSLRTGYVSQSGDVETLSVPSSRVPLNEDIELLFYNKNIMMYQDGAFKWEFAGTRSNTITPMQVMLNTRVTKTERIQFYEGDTLIFDGVPRVRAEDGVAGLYDLVGGGFYTSSNPSLIYYD